MNTGIGRIGAQHTLTSPQDDTLYLFNSAMWCTHPLLQTLDNIGADTLELTEGSKIVTATGLLEFILLCENFNNSNQPYNSYIAYYDGSGYGVLEIDYVLSNDTLILKYPAIATVSIQGTDASQINYWGTPVLKEVEVREVVGALTEITVANKYSQNVLSLLDYPYYMKNEGGFEPTLVSNSADINVILKY